MSIIGSKGRWGGAHPPLCNSSRVDGSRVGSSLLACCFNDARTLGIRKLHCLSTLNAERFYRASGFKTIGPIDVSMGRSLTFPSVLTSRELA